MKGNIAHVWPYQDDALGERWCARVTKDPHDGLIVSSGSGFSSKEQAIQGCRLLNPGLTPLTIRFSKPEIEAADLLQEAVSMLDVADFCTAEDERYAPVLVEMIRAFLKNISQAGS